MQKEKKLKDILRIRNCLVKKFKKPKEDRSNQDLFFTQVDLKLVARVLRMSRITTEQLVWCHTKLSNIVFIEGKVHREPSFLLFPCWGWHCTLFENKFTCKCRRIRLVNQSSFSYSSSVPQLDWSTEFSVVSNTYAKEVEVAFKLVITHGSNLKKKMRMSCSGEGRKKIIYKYAVLFPWRNGTEAILSDFFRVATESYGRSKKQIWSHNVIQHCILSRKVHLICTQFLVMNDLSSMKSQIVGCPLIFYLLVMWCPITY